MMESKKFSIQGTFKQKGEIQKFTKEIAAVNEALATEKLYALLGSHHRLKRSKIQIEKIEKIKS